MEISKETLLRAKFKEDEDDEDIQFAVCRANMPELMHRHIAERPIVLWFCVLLISTAVSYCCCCCRPLLLLLPPLLRILLPMDNSRYAASGRGGGDTVVVFTYFGASCFYAAA